MSETDWKVVHRMEDAAQRVSSAAQQVEDAVTRIAHLLEDGYGGNGLRLIEALESVSEQDKARIATLEAELLAARDLLAEQRSIAHREAFEDVAAMVAVRCTMQELVEWLEARLA